MQGHIRKRTYTTKAGKETVNWYVVVDLGPDANAKRRQKWHGGYRTRKEAEVARTKIVGDLHAGTYTEPTKLTLREWVEDKWLPDRQNAGQAEHLRLVPTQHPPSRAPHPGWTQLGRHRTRPAQHAVRRPA